MKQIIPLAILLSSCINTALPRELLEEPLSKLTVCVQSVLPSETFSATVKAVVFWERSLGLPISSYYEIGNGCDILISELQPGEISKAGGVPPEYRGAETSVGIPCYIELINGRYNRQGIDSSYVIAHEIGHCLGAMHQSYGLMKADYQWEVLPSCLDSAAAQAVIEAGIVEVPSLQVCPSDNGSDS